MKNKTSFILHHDTLSVINELTDEQAGKIIKEILAYSEYLNNQKEAKKPNGLSGLLNAVFHPFREQLNRDFEQYLAISIKNAENGKKGGRPSFKKNQNKPKKAYKDNDNDKDSDNDKYISIIDFLNKTINSNYRYTTEKTKNLMKARIKENFTVEDFKIVISKKAKEWIGTEQEKYLRPETLFGTKFESYLNQKESVVNQKPQQGNKWDENRKRIEQFAREFGHIPQNENIEEYEVLINEQ